MFNRLLCLSLCLLMGTCFAQSPYSGTLVLDRTLPIPSQQNSLLVLPIVSGSDGSALFRLFERPRSPLIKIWPDGKKSVHITFDGLAPELQKATDSAFTITPSGEILVIATYQDHMYLVTFDRDGVYKTHSQFDSAIWIEHMAAIGDGQTILIAGFEKPEEGKSPNTPFTAIYTSNAQLVKILRFGDDLAGFKSASPKMAESATPDLSLSAKKLPLPEQQPPKNESLEKMDRVVLGCARAGGDGKVYLLRHGVPALIHVLDSTGTLQRTLKINPPESGMQPAEMQVAGGKIALEFSEQKDNGKVAIVIADSNTGEILQTYAVANNVGSAFASFQLDNRFSFIGAQKNNLAIEWVKIDR